MTFLSFFLRVNKKSEHIHVWNILVFRKLLLANHSRTNAHFLLFLCGIRFTVRLRFSVTVRVSINVSVRVKVLLTRLTLGVLHGFVHEWLASRHFIVLVPFGDHSENR